MGAITEETLDERRRIDPNLCCSAAQRVEAVSYAGIVDA